MVRNTEERCECEWCDESPDCECECAWCDEPIRECECGEPIPGTKEIRYSDPCF